MPRKHCKANSPNKPKHCKAWTTTSTFGKIAPARGCSQRCDIFLRYHIPSRLVHLTQAACHREDCPRSYCMEHARPTAQGNNDALGNVSERGDPEPSCLGTRSVGTLAKLSRAPRQHIVYTKSVSTFFPCVFSVMCSAAKCIIRAVPARCTGCSQDVSKSES